MAINNFDSLKDIDVIDYFGYTIAKRGESYFREGLVTNVNIVNRNYVTGVVKGSKDYDVEIKIENNNLYTHCTCKCDFPCKHAAAVLYYLIDKNHEVDKGKIFIQLVRKMNGILSINKNNIKQFISIVREEVKESQLLNGEEKINRLFDLLKAIKSFSVQVYNAQIRNIILEEFQNVDYNSDYFYEKMLYLKDEDDYYLMLEIVPYLDKDHITNKKLLELFSTCAFLLESYYSNVKSSQSLGIYNFNFKESDYRKIKTNKYKVGEYVKGLYEEKRYNEIEPIYFSQTNLVFKTVYYYIKSKEGDVQNQVIEELINSIVTKYDFERFVNLNLKLSDSTYIYLLEHYNKQVALELIKKDNKIDVLLDNISLSNFELIDDIFDDIKEEYNNKLLFTYQKVIYFHLKNMFNLSDETFKKHLKNLYSLKSGKYILYFMYRALSNQYYWYDHNLMLIFKNFLIQNNIYSAVM